MIKIDYSTEVDFTYMGNTVAYATVEPSNLNNGVCFNIYDAAEQKLNGSGCWEATWDDERDSWPAQSTIKATIERVVRAANDKTAGA